MIERILMKLLIILPAILLLVSKITFANTQCTSVPNAKPFIIEECGKKENQTDCIGFTIRIADNFVFTKWHRGCQESPNLAEVPFMEGNDTSLQQLRNGRYKDQSLCRWNASN